MHINLVWAPTFLHRWACLLLPGVSEQKMPLNICRHLFGGTERQRQQQLNKQGRCLRRCRRGSVKSLKRICVRSRMFVFAWGTSNADSDTDSDSISDSKLDVLFVGLWRKLWVYVTTKMTVE